MWHICRRRAACMRSDSTGMAHSFDGGGNNSNRRPWLAPPASHPRSTPPRTASIGRHIPQRWRCIHTCRRSSGRGWPVNQSVVRLKNQQSYFHVISLTTLGRRIRHFSQQRSVMRSFHGMNRMNLLHLIVWRLNTILIVNVYLWSDIDLIPLTYKWPIREHSQANYFKTKVLYLRKYANKIQRHK